MTTKKFEKTALSPYTALYLPLYELDGDSFMSRDVYGHLCTVTGAVWGSQGRTFDGGDDDVDLGLWSPWDSNNKTAIIWVKTSSDITTRRELLCCSTLGGQDAGYQLEIGLTANKFSFVVYDGATNNQPLDSPTISGLTWYCLAGVHNNDSSQMIVYLNGVAGTPKAITGYNPVTTRKMFIGRRTGAGFVFDSIIGEVLVYNRALTPAEIMNSYLSTKWRYT